MGLFLLRGGFLLKISKEALDDFIWSKLICKVLKAGR